MQLDYLYYTDIYQVRHALDNSLRLSYFQSITQYGLGLKLYSKPQSSQSAGYIPIVAHLNSLNDILIVKNISDLLTIMADSLANEYINQYGNTNRFGEKFIKSYVLSQNKKGLHLLQDNILMIYNSTIIKYVELFSDKYKNIKKSSGSIVPIEEINPTSNWILDTNTWRDSGEWIDTEVWKD